jgi:hypothetical protein
MTAIHLTYNHTRNPGAPYLRAMRVIKESESELQNFRSDVAAIAGEVISQHSAA